MSPLRYMALASSVFDHQRESLPCLSESVPSIRKQVRGGKNDENPSIQATRRDDHSKENPGARCGHNGADSHF
jgi:hypothetical protein